jgi:hypothetical protein
MAAPSPSASDAESRRADELAAAVALAKATPPGGLAEPDAAARLLQHGPNELAEKRVHPLRLFLGYLWGPMPIMIWIA